MELKIITVGNGSKEYPGNFTKKEIEIINYNLYGWSLNLFSGISKIGSIRVDYNCKEATHRGNVFKYLDLCIEYNYNFNTIIIDAPYNQKFATKYQKIGNTPKQFIIFASVKKTTELFEKIIKIAPAIIILKSWNYYCLKGYKIEKCYVCYPGGYRKSTFLIIMHKNN